MASELTAEEVCLILKAAHDAGVRKLSFRGLAVHLGEEIPKWPERPAPTPLAPADAVLDPGKKFLDKMEVQVKEQQLDEFTLLDPEELENLIVQDELMDAVKGATDGEDQNS